MKASREQLKVLMKELLVEILQEGLGNSSVRSSLNKITAAGVTSEQRYADRRKLQFDPRLDVPLSNVRVPTAALKENIHRAAGGNPIMVDILADTAMTTLPAQLSYGDAMDQQLPGMPQASRNHSPVQQEQFHGEVADSFGDSAQPDENGSSYWAALAFAPRVKKSA